jgi:hypothetical protein
MTTRVKQCDRFYKAGFAFAIYVLLNVITSRLFAQTDSVLGFFPLYTGDLHQFHYHYSYFACPPFPPVLQTHSSHHVEQVWGDTLLPTGFQYKILTSNVPGDSWQRYLRVDTASANVYRYEGYPSPHEVLMDSLRATTGSWFIRDGWMMTECTGVDTTTILGVLTTVKRFRAHYVHGANYGLAYGLGRSSHVTYQDDGCYPVLDNLYRDIIFARIGGQEYGTFVSVGEQQSKLPTHFELSQNYPNPFNPSTVIEVSVPQARYVTLAIFDLLGQEVATVVSGELQPGKHIIRWNATDVASGLYLYRLKAGDVVQTKRLVLLK